MHKKMFGIGVIGLFSAVLLGGCSKEDAIDESVDNIKIEMRHKYLEAYSQEYNHDDNTIILTEDEYKTPYLKLPEDDRNEFRYEYIAALASPLSKMPEKSSDIQINDSKGNELVKFNNQEIEFNNLPDENYEKKQEFIDLVEDGQSLIEENRSIDEFERQMKKRFGKIVNKNEYDESEEIYVVNLRENEESPEFNIAMTLRIYQRVAPSDLTVKIYSSDNTKLAEIKDAKIVNYNTEVFNDDFLSIGQEYGAVEDLEYDVNERLKELE